MALKRLCVFCGSSSGARREYADAAVTVGKELARRNVELVYGGGRVGLMGTVADATLAAGGRVIGIIPRPLATKELAHDGLTELRVVETMHERKALMAQLSDAFIALPGGFGTLEEFCEVLTWAQLGLHRKPCALLNVRGYFDPLLNLFDHAVTESFVMAEHRGIVLQDSDVSKLLDAIASWKMPNVKKWIDLEGT
ncbi:MAG TPA: TIGR00730 family Rossman fold protein [Planctomycetota bacterium]|nr:TIGR00730 family Rossman fold protein [Planctomycetota bacterium]